MKKTALLVALLAGFAAAPLIAADAAAAPAAEKKADAVASTLAAKAAAPAKLTMKDAKKLLNEEKFAEALEAYKSISPLKGKADEAWRLNNIGLCNINLKQFEAAVEPLEAAVKTDPKNYVAWNNLGAVYQNLKQNDKAKEAYAKAIEAAKSVGASTKAEASLQYLESLTNSAAAKAEAKDAVKDAVQKVEAKAEEKK
jgi:tetratricopeptide (TPR) repeat protein